MEVDLDRIFPNPDQPRKRFDAEQLQELADSLKQDGLLQPVVVRPRGADAYELVAGERRWRAAQLAGMMKIPVVVREVDDPKLLELALIENLQREQLDPIDEARAFQTLIDDHGLTQQAVAERVGRQRVTITNALRLLNLAPTVQRQIQDGLISAGHAKALVSITDMDLQIRVATQAAKEGLSVRQVEARVKQLRAAPKEKRPAPATDPNLVAAEERLASALGTKVKIVTGKKGGRLELYAFSEEELQRVYGVVLRGCRG
ncbi:MAG: ParB/RepB/Spo0J family partition protein [Acidobacteriota bacterium]|nr:ParB/RepB/Spo0J family partition protein [Acidobacteriota bacterium]MDH3786291.1 ParB/RepB/Spo0J family partition protein [Acidobacteriota bacterium]